MEKHIVKVNAKYNIIITNNGTRNYYRLQNDDSDTLVESFNRDSFLIKANKIVKLSTTIQNIVASY